MDMASPLEASTFALKHNETREYTRSREILQKVFLSLMNVTHLEDGFLNQFASLGSWSCAVPAGRFGLGQFLKAGKL